MNVGNNVELVGEYYGDSYAETEPHRKAIGWKGLIIGDIIGGRAAPYKIVRDGIAIGWAPASSIQVPTLHMAPQQEIIQNIQTLQTVQNAQADEEFISVNFVSMGSQDINNYSIVCKQSWLFSKLEEKLYKDFPQYNKPETYFMFKANMIERNKTLKENNIGNNSIVNVFNEDI